MGRYGIQLLFFSLPLRYQSGYGNLIFSWQRRSVLRLYTSVIKAWFRNLTLRLLALTHPVNSPSLAHYGWCAYVWVFPSDVTLKDELIKNKKLSERERVVVSMEVLSSIMWLAVTKRWIGKVFLLAKFQTLSGIKNRGSLSSICIESAGAFHLISLY